MSQITDPHLPKIIHSCVTKKSREGEQFIPQHVFDYILSGTSEVHFGNKSFTFKAGDFRFIRRNRLNRFVKHPPEGGEYRSISIFIDQNTLFSLHNEYPLPVIDAYNNDNVIPLKPNKIFNNYIDSLLPYLNNGNEISTALISMKVKEAVMIFIETNPTLKSILFDFSEPGKIDLEAYMNEHYKFNGDLNHFAYLTGRSLSTFKRDFERIFHTTPNRWLLQKRLDDAHYLIREKKWKATDVYMEVGFKDYSHFSMSFKKAFGCAPSLVSAL